MNSMRNLFITGLSLFLGISIPQFFGEYWGANRHGLVQTNAGWVSINSNLACLNYKKKLLKHEIGFVSSRDIKLKKS